MNASKLEKAVVTFICLQVAVLVMVVMARSTQPTETVSAGSAHVHSARYTAYDARYSAPSADTTTIRFGDCMADNATGDLYTTGNPWCATVPSVQTITENKRTNDESTVPTITETAGKDTTETIDNGGEQVPTDNEVPSEQPTDDKKHCNNGEGNGGEGCSPANSDHANNDENQTSPADDHGNSDHGNDGSHGEQGNGH